MTDTFVEQSQQVMIEGKEFGRLIDALASRGYRVLGPTIRDGAVVYDDVTSVSDLPVGYVDDQGGGSYRLKKRAGESLFAFVHGPHSWKKHLFPPTLRLWQARREGSSFKVVEENAEPPRLALLGVRPCELAAIAIQDRVFMGGAYVDPTYRTRRERLFVVAVNCARPGGTCFCVSMGTGPRVSDQSSFDIALTEVIEGKKHYFVAESGSPQGGEVLAEIPHRPATDEEKAAAAQVSAKAAEKMGRTLDTTDIKPLLYNNSEHPAWEDVAARCLTCGNCTMVCPTCFCTTVEDVTDLSGGQAERWRKWDSCFTTEFSYIYGGSVRVSGKSRYRQWMTHKLASWIDQFGTSGCVGCGRCITWCPVGIDITAEVAAIRGNGATRKK